MKEKWKLIKEYPNYSVSNLGNVKNNKKNKKLKLVNDGRGYFCVSLYKDKIPKLFRVHTLVANAFLNNYENKPQVNHIDGDKINNRCDNLEWATNQENIQHAYDNKLMNGRKGEAHPMRKLTEDQVLEIVKKENLKIPRDVIAKEYNINKTNIYNIVTGKGWTHVTGIKKHYRTK